MRARKFLRVSTGKQEETKQLDDVAAYVAAQGYEDDGRAYLAHGKSAYRGKHLPVLDEALRDMKNGEYDVLVLWDSSRFTRMGAESIFTLMAQAREAGGRIEFAAAHAQGLNQACEWTPVMLALQATADNLASRQKAEHSKREVAHHQKIGSAHGRAPWGFEIVGAKDSKQFVPTDLGREWIPRLYDWVLAGRSSRNIAKAWTDLAVGGKTWSENTIQFMLTNPLHYGARRSGGNLATEPLVDFGTWQAAVETLRARARRGRSATKHPAPLVRPYCGACFGVHREGCQNGLPVMYMIRTPRGNGPWYHCRGSGTLRRGCGAPLVPAAMLDAIVLERFGSHPQTYRERVFVPGRDTADELRDLNRQIAEAAARGDYAAVANLSGKAQEASEAEDVRGRWELRDTGLTIGQHFQGLDREGQRAFIAESMILAERTADGSVMAGELIISDDGDGGVLDRWV